MSGEAYDAGSATTVHIVSQSPHTFAFRIFVAQPGETVWTPLDTGDIKTPAKAHGPFPSGTQLSFAILMGGNPHTEWSTQIVLSQRGVTLACSPPRGTGICDSDGVSEWDPVATLS